MLIDDRLLDGKAVADAILSALATRCEIMLSDIMIGQYFPGKSVVHALDPRTKIVLTLVYISSIFMAADIQPMLS